MQKKLYYLSTCDTCARIMKELKIKKYNFDWQDIKTQSITEAQLDEMKALAGSYESLFSRIALKFRAWKLNEKKLTEKDYKKYILEEYTFLKRPVFLFNGKIFIGNSPKNIEAVAAELKLI
ncbi:MAG: arsenate reductase family protein [Chitinophagales bacterium]